MLAATEERFDWLKSAHAKGRYLGIEAPNCHHARGAHEMLPIMDPEDTVRRRALQSQ